MLGFPEEIIPHIDPNLKIKHNMKYRYILYTYIYCKDYNLYNPYLPISLGDKY